MLFVFERWIGSVMPQTLVDCLEVLNQLSDAIHRSYAYGRREERGTRSPRETIALAEGSESALTGGGSTHAWADVFIPGVGWTDDLTDAEPILPRRPQNKLA